MACSLGIRQLERKRENVIYIEKLSGAIEATRQFRCLSAATQYRVSGSTSVACRVSQPSNPSVFKEKPISNGRSSAIKQEKEKDADSIVASTGNQSKKSESFDLTTHQ